MSGRLLRMGDEEFRFTLAAEASGTQKAERSSLAMTLGFVLFGRFSPRLSCYRCNNTTRLLPATRYEL